MTEHRDPAVEAAQRAWQARGATEQEREDSLADDDCVSTFANEVAREALAPIRELHKERGGYCRECCHSDPARWMETYQTWPCDTARLIYTSEELNDE